MKGDTKKLQPIDHLGHLKILRSSLVIPGVLGHSRFVPYGAAKRQHYDFFKIVSKDQRDIADERNLLIFIWLYGVRVESIILRTLTGGMGSQDFACNVGFHCF